MVLRTQILRNMAPSILGIGVSASSPTVPAERREALGKVLEDMDADMRAFSSGWEIFYVEPDMDFGLITRKLKEKKWDVVLVGSKHVPWSSLTQRLARKIRYGTKFDMGYSGPAYNVICDAFLREDRQCGARGVADDEIRLQHAA